MVVVMMMVAAKDAVCQRSWIPRIHHGFQLQVLCAALEVLARFAGKSEALAPWDLF